RLGHCVEIRGRVTTPDGGVVPNVTVYMHPMDFGHEGSDKAKTDASGRYEFAELWEGDYIMEAVPPITLGNHPMALPISIRPGQIHVEYGDILDDVDFVLSPVPARNVKVRLIAESQINPLDGDLEIRPILQDQTEEAESVSVHSLERGEPTAFVFTGLAPGQYFIQMKKTWATHPPLAGGQLVEIDARNDVSVELDLQPIVKVSYTGRHLGGQALPSQMCVVLEDAHKHRGVFGPVCPTSEKQQVELPSDVTYKMTVIRDGIYLDSITINEQPEVASAFQLPREGQEASMDLVFGTSGRILINAKDVEDIGATLLLLDGNGVPVDAIDGSWDHASANHLKIDGIRPGRHRLLIWSGETPPCDLKRLSSCAGFGEWVTVRGGATLAIIPRPRKP
ncbi:MAG TPA: hypothetical protein VGL72_06470, partial [Bryobacteraceae bacterium]